jgi:DNA-binding NtrC family response regulator
MTKKPNDIGPKTILFMNAAPEENTGISFLLEEADFSTHSVASPAELKKKMREASIMAVIIDLDSVTVDNRTIKDLALQVPNIPFLFVSKESFHPELKDSIRDYVYACLTKPIDSEELNYWLKSIKEDKV